MFGVLSCAAVGGPQRRQSDGGGYGRRGGGRYPVRGGGQVNYPGDFGGGAKRRFGSRRLDARHAAAQEGASVARPPTSRARPREWSRAGADSTQVRRCMRTVCSGPIRPVAARVRCSCCFDGLVDGRLRCVHFASARYGVAGDLVEVVEGGHGAPAEGEECGVGLPNALEKGLELLPVPYLQGGRYCMPPPPQASCCCFQFAAG